MAKPKMPRITEPDQGEVHYKADPLGGNVTLCGLTDFIGHAEPGKETDAPITCEACKAARAWCCEHAD